MGRRSSVEKARAQNCQGDSNIRRKKLRRHGIALQGGRDSVGLELFPGDGLISVRGGVLFYVMMDALAEESQNQRGRHARAGESHAGVFGRRETNLLDRPVT